MNLLSVPAAATVMGKSIQTIRRMIKAKKIPCKRQKTPQGFVYLIPKESISKFAKEIPTSQLGSRASSQKKILGSQMDSRIHRPVKTIETDFFEKEINRFNSAIQKLIEQNERDKENFFQLIKTFQDRVFMLENQIKLLEAPRRKWWRLW